MNNRPPHIATKFLKWFCDPQLLESIQGDLEEQFEEDVVDYGVGKAKRRYIWTVIRFFRPRVIKILKGTQKLNNMGMLKNYLITSLRFIRRERTFALMNIFGLALGIGCALVIYKIINHETSFDKHHTNFNRLYRVVNEYQSPEGDVYFAGQPHMLATGLRADFGIKAAMSFYEEDALITIENKSGDKQRFQEQEGIAFVEPEFLDLFDFEWISGDATAALNDPGKVILTKTLAQKYFGVDADEVHQVIGRKLVLENEKTIYVSAVIEDLPTTTDLPFIAIFHYKDQDATNPYFYEGKSWQEYNSATNCFVLLNADQESRSVDDHLKGYLAKYQPEDMARDRELKLQPMADLHSSDMVPYNYRGATVSDNKLIALGIVGLFMIITACINFINLATAQAVKRSKEVGVRKSLGSRKGQLVLQFLTETLLITLIATGLGLLIAQLLSIQIENIFGYQIELALLSGGEAILTLSLIVFFVAFSSGLYPAFILARMNPILAVKNSLSSKQTSGLLSLRRALVVFQFAITQILIIGILVLNLQMDYFLNKDLGFNQDSIITIKLPDSDSLKLSVLKTGLLANSSIEQVSFSTTGPLAEWKVNNPIYYPGMVDEDANGNLKTVDESYIDLFELELIAGRNYEVGDPARLAVINRKMTQTFGFENPEDAIGESFEYGRSGGKFQIVGVVEDFHAGSLRGEMDNVVFANLSWNIYQASIKFNVDKASFSDLQNLVGSIEKHWSLAYPENVFDFEFYDDHLASLYKIEQSVADIFKVIVAIAIIIGCMGLYGLVSFMANQKTKEIGIRKVMGATVLNIWSIFSKEMVLLLGIAFVVAAPVAYYSMSSWLNNYEYRIDLNVGVFAVSILISLFIALITIGYKSIKASTANPVLSLRDE